MKASMGKLVKQVLANQATAKILSSAIISQSQSRHSGTIRIKDVLPNGKVLVLKRVKIDI